MLTGMLGGFSAFAADKTKEITITTNTDDNPFLRVALYSSVFKTGGPFTVRCEMKIDSYTPNKSDANIFVNIADGRDSKQEVVDVYKRQVLSLLFTASVTYIPQYVVLGATRLIDTYWAVILIALQSSLGLYLMMNFMQRIPDEMLEAARIDGAKEIRIFWTVVMPNVKPAWLTLMIFSFQSLWNSNGGGFIYNESLKTLPAVMASISAGGVVRTGVTAARCV